MNKKSIKQLLLIIFFMVSSNVIAEEKNTITTENLRVILAPSVARSTSAYGNIKNTGDAPDILLNISTDAAGMIMLHKTEITNGMAEMNHIEDYVLEAGKTLVLKPMSYHLMLVNIDHKIIKKDGEVAITLEFKKAGKITFKVPVLEE